VGVLYKRFIVHRPLGDLRFIGQLVDICEGKNAFGRKKSLLFRKSSLFLDVPSTYQYALSVVGSEGREIYSFCFGVTCMKPGVSLLLCTKLARVVPYRLLSQRGTILSVFLHR
jgi:hypothetical protein